MMGGLGACPRETGGEPVARCLSPVPRSEPRASERRLIEGRCLSPVAVWIEGRCLSPVAVWIEGRLAAHIRMFECL